MRLVGGGGENEASWGVRMRLVGGGVRMRLVVEGGENEASCGGG